MSFRRELAALRSIFKLFDSPTAKGDRGEARVSSRMQRQFRGEGHIALNDLTLRTSRGTTQIDHVLIASSGVFVIETKNMSGWIFGGKDQARWTQVFLSKKIQFQNPLRQNYRHVKTVQELLGLKDDQVHSVVVFAGSAVPKTRMPENVLWGTRFLNKYLCMQRASVFRPDEVERLASCLRTAAIGSGKETNRAHVASLRVQAAERRDKSRCPKCGSELVERKNKRTGEAFWGCSTFPKCRGTRIS